MVESARFKQIAGSGLELLKNKVKRTAGACLGNISGFVTRRFQDTKKTASEKISNLPLKASAVGASVGVLGAGAKILWEKSAEMSNVADSFAKNSELFGSVLTFASPFLLPFKYINSVAYVKDAALVQGFDINSEATNLADSAQWLVVNCARWALNPMDLFAMISTIESVMDIATSLAVMGKLSAEKVVSGQGAPFNILNKKISLESVFSDLKKINLKNGPGFNKKIFEKIKSLELSNPGKLREMCNQINQSVLNKTNPKIIQLKIDQLTQILGTKEGKEEALGQAKICLMIFAILSGNGVFALAMSIITDSTYLFSLATAKGRQGESKLILKQIDWANSATQILTGDVFNGLYGISQLLTTVTAGFKNAICEQQNTVIPDIKNLPQNIRDIPANSIATFNRGADKLRNLKAKFDIEYQKQLQKSHK